METKHLTYCFCRKDGHLQQIIKDLASIIYHNVFLLFSISIILTFFIHLFYSLLQLPLQNKAHNVPVFFISCHEC